MQSSSGSAAQSEAILEWLQKEMGYRPLGPYASSTKISVPTAESLRKICRGNMIPVWSFLLKRVKSDKTVENIRRNILVHGADDGGKGRRKEKSGTGKEDSSSSSSREMALQERELAEKEVERLRQFVRRQRKELKARMIEVSREEAERKRMLDERSNYRHKHVMLETYDQQCDEAAKYLLSTINASSAIKDDSKSAQDVILIETTKERNVRKVCESLALQMSEKIRNTFPAYEGNGIQGNPQLEDSKLGIDTDSDIPTDIKDVIADCLKSPPQILQAIILYTQRLQTLIAREIEKIDVRADAEALRYKYENNTVIEASSPDVSSPLQYHLCGYGKPGGDSPAKGTEYQLLERQKAHVQQFLATEDALNKAAEARNMSQLLWKRLHGSGDTVSSLSHVTVGASQNMSSLRQLELEVWAKEREAAGLRASLNTLMSEVHRLDKECAERKEAENSLRKKWKKIEEFDARRSELESVYNALLKANMDAASFWSQQPLAAREYASSTIIPACNVVLDLSNNAKDIIDNEVSAFYSTPDNSLYMLPSTPQGLLESMGANGSTGPEAVAAAERNAAMLTARAGARDPSAVPSVCRISAALQYPAGLDGSDAGLSSVLESMDFCLKLRGSEACVLEDLATAINLVHVRNDLVESGHALLKHAHRALQEYDRTTNYCLNVAAEQEKTVTEKWLPELSSAVLNAHKCLEDCKYVRGLLDEWWEQPASNVVDWVAVDGENVATWQNHVKQLLAFYDNNYLSEAKHQKKLPSAVVVGTVYCDTCFHQDFPKASHFISGASVALECNDTSSRPSFRQEVKTNKNGEFRIHLPFSVSKHARKIRGCSVRLLSSNEPFCAVAATATSSSLHLKSRKRGTHIFSAGFFTFKPLKQPLICDQKPSTENFKKLSSPQKLSPIDNPDDPAFPPPLRDPPSNPPPLGLPLPPLPQLPLLPPLPGIPLLPPVPKKENAAKASQLLDKKVTQPTTFLLPPNPFNPPSIFPPNPLQPPSSLLPPLPFLPPPFSIPPVLPSPPSVVPPVLPSPPAFNLPPVPGLDPSLPPPAPPTSPLPLPPFPIQPTPGFPGEPPAEVSAQSKTSSP
ncbi:UNVERIFIED_CONTAM: AUGMIN subunit [Sesamum calycinum]|uniref:AUGMIN subunit n=1 Tax=Sesamum calycinum TaxID=2727403 RepID=A0AAW2LFH1_9LAMI